MGRLYTNFAAAGALLWLVAPITALGIEIGGREPILRVKVFNYAEAPGETLAQGQEFAEKVFQNAGLRIEWTEPLKATTHPSREESSGKPSFGLRIVPNSMIGAWAGDHDLLGFSLVPANGGMGSLGGAYYERIVELSRRLGGDPAVTLGYVLAHELGHLVLGAQSHSYSGIMSHPFEGRHLRLASQGRLGFTSAQAKRFREQLRPRR